MLGVWLPTQIKKLNKNNLKSKTSTFELPSLNLNVINKLLNNNKLISNSVESISNKNRKNHKKRKNVSKLKLKPNNLDILKIDNANNLKAKQSICEITSIDW